MKLKCIIVEDEPLAAKVIEKYIAQIDNLTLVAKCSNAVEAFNTISKEKIDLIFLDIKMPQISGIDFLKTIKNPPKIIFTTAYRDYALEGYELDVIDYLLKPISFERFLKSVNKVMSLLQPQLSNETTEKPQSKKEEAVFIKSDKKMIKINFDDILYIEGLKDYIQIITLKEKIITYMSLSAIEEKLSKEKFIRIHRSYIVSLRRIKAYTAVSVELPNKILTIGRHYKKMVLDRLEKFQTT